MNKASQS